MYGNETIAAECGGRGEVMSISNERIENAWHAYHICPLMQRSSIEAALRADDEWRSKAHAEETEGEPELPEGIRHIAGEYMLASGDVFITEEWSSDEIAAIARHMRYMEK